ncbi:regulatory protein RecX [Sphingobium aquiterrae]|uniref:regulatory protein RecX n=1 Tax=Sphingobium aquiterrae TaxID=2038656 RepID=UPI003019464F
MSPYPPRNARNGRPARPRPPLDEESLRALALHYAGRYATTRARLAAYLHRKIGERGWGEEAPADVDALVDRFADLRYVDDAAYAQMKGEALVRRGYGARRIGETLRAAGVGEEDRQRPESAARANRWDAAHILARRKRIGPFATAPADRPTREKQIAAFLRAGHDYDTARRWVDALPGEMPDRDPSDDFED